MTALGLLVPMAGRFSAGASEEESILLGPEAHRGHVMVASELTFPTWH